MKESDVDIVENFIKPNGKPFNLREKLFVLEYIADPNFDTAKAAVRAGYSETIACSKAYLWVSDKSTNPKPYVLKAINKVIASKLKKIDEKGDYVIDNITKVVNRCMQEVSPLRYANGEPKLTKNAEGELKEAYVFDSSGALKGLELLGRNEGKFITKRFEHSGEISHKVRVYVIPSFNDKINKKDIQDKEGQEE